MAIKQVEVNTPFHLVVNSDYLGKLGRLTQLCDPGAKLPSLRGARFGRFGMVKRENIGGFIHRDYAAVKRIRNFGMTGLEYFESISALASEGVLCAAPIAATRDRYVSKWIEGTLFMDSKIGYSPFDEYQNALDDAVERLKSQGRWNPAWFLDNAEDGFILYDLKSANPLRRFIAVDPVYSRPEF